MTKAAGTLLWMAPEVFRGDENYGPAVDVYSFGIVMWELVTREEPWKEIISGRSPTVLFQALNHALQTGRRPTIPDGTITTAPGYVALMRRCWAGDPVDRPPFQDVASELAACLRESV